MYIFSEEDMNLKDIVAKWLENQPKETQNMHSYLINEYFFKGMLSNIQYKYSYTFWNTIEWSYVYANAIALRSTLQIVKKDWQELQKKNTYYFIYADSLKNQKNILNHQYFLAVNWIKSEGDLVIPCPQVTIVKTGLTQLNNISSKSHFCVGLINGLGGLLSTPSAEVFAQKVLLFYTWINLLITSY